jgi:hypothetical protein
MASRITAGPPAASSLSIASSIEADKIRDIREKIDSDMARLNSITGAGSSSPY